MRTCLLLVMLSLDATGQPNQLSQLLQRHANARQSVLQLYVEVHVYDPTRKRLLFTRRFAIDPERSRHTTYTAPALVQQLGYPQQVETTLIEHYADGKNCFFLQTANTENFPAILPPDQKEQRHKHFFQGARTDYLPHKVESKRLLEISALRKLTSYCQDIGVRGDLYLEDLIRRSDQVKLLSNGRIEVHLSSGEGMVHRERKVIQLDLQNDYAIREVRTWAWNAKGQFLVESSAKVLTFQRVNGVVWPKEIETVERRPNSTRKLVTKFTRIVINQPLPPEAFDFRIPENAVIVHYDPDTNETKQVLIYGKNNQVARTFTPEEYNEYLQQKEGLGPGPHPAENGTLWPVVATLGLLVLAGGLALGWRRAARRG